MVAAGRVLLEQVRHIEVSIPWGELVFLAATGGMAVVQLAHTVYVAINRTRLRAEYRAWLAQRPARERAEVEPLAERRMGLLIAALFVCGLALLVGLYFLTIRAPMPYALTPAWFCLVDVLMILEDAARGMTPELGREPLKPPLVAGVVFGVIAAATH
jgi:hypothetical protein